MRARNKYGAKPSHADGKRYDSKSERDYSNLLRAAEQTGELAFFLEQVPLRLPGGTSLRLDFVEFWRGDDDVLTVRWVDVKSPITAKKDSFKIKKREVEEHLGIIIETVNGKGEPL